MGGSKGDRTTNARDERAFQEFVEAYGDRALRFAFVTLRSRPDAEDVTQEAFMRLWRHTVRRGVDTLTPALLYHTVTNLCRDRMRHAKRHPEDPTDFLETPHPAVDDRLPDPKPSLVEAVMQLAPPERQCVLLFYYMDRSLKDTARVLGVSEQVVKTRLYRARQRLKNQLEPLWKEGSL
ncbi:RNA polymerase, sigma-24 subunit, ECF subfamily [Sulfobacillus acidophilus DSM 10332]|uniref:RNA polymerase, sigma-24 subunit, ECF subfamily n=1 Tax=Sulfobacillus acidophilus (strain ATCC 700253 / DSM 10332 / NAL) TaxID=679936 RepID=G8U074_SULAD|nr:RNA polymerase, sigma-24 subunit, ECF subfamily [Sulfobacillus acidophilus DSM 10332]